MANKTNKETEAGDPNVSLSFKKPEEPLVNESDITDLQKAQDAILALQDRLKKTEEWLVDANQKKKVRQEEIVNLRNQLKLDRNGKTSRTFRLYMTLLEGFTQRGMFDRDRLAKLAEHANKDIQRNLEHLANLAELAETVFKRKEEAYSAKESASLKPQAHERE
jgi:hypothetical protein